MYYEVFKRNYYKQSPVWKEFNLENDFILKYKYNEKSYF